MLAAVRRLAGAVEINLTPQETPWTTPLDEDDEHATFDTAAVDAYFAAATRAALVLAALRAPYRGRSTPVNAWWGSFDLAVSLFSGQARRAAGATTSSWRNAGDAEQVELGWWPGDARYPKRGVLRLRASPRRPGSRTPRSQPAAAHWDAKLGEFILDWDDIRDDPDPARERARVRALCGHARLRGLRLGSGAGGQRRGHSAARASERPRRR